MIEAWSSGVNASHSLASCTTGGKGCDTHITYKLGAYDNYRRIFGGLFCWLQTSRGEVIQGKGASICTFELHYIWALSLLREQSYTLRSWHINCFNFFLMFHAGTPLPLREKYLVLTVTVSQSGQYPFEVLDQGGYHGTCWKVTCTLSQGPYNGRL